MRIVTFRSDSGEPHVGVVRGSDIVDITATAGGPADILSLIEHGQAGLGLARTAAALDSATTVPFSEERLLAPIPRPRKNVFCVGRNYAEHAAESLRAWKESGAMPPPQYPAFFTKAPTAIIGPYDEVPYDSGVSKELDWECELAVVIGTAGKNIKREAALSHVFGYMVLNDLSARDLQKRHGGQFFKGKSLDGSCPIGPCIVTADEVGDPNNLELWTRVNGVEKQHSNTNTMLLDVAGVIESLSEGMTLEPGDIIATGTPAGVGFARTPPEFLFPGDTVECEVEKIGIIRNRVAGK